MLGFRKKKGGPPRPFTHAPDCKILKIDPSYEPPWQEIETGYWVTECRCGKEHWRESLTDGRVRLDPLDPATFRHAPQCEHRDTTDPVLIRAILRVKDGMEEGYWWVECSACAHAWQVPHYAAESVG